MVKLTKIYTRSGDDGESGLVDGQRRAKNDARFCAIGDVDEANAAIGLARATLPADHPAHLLLGQVQNDLFDLGADLATPFPPAGDNGSDGALRITDRGVQTLEHEIDTLSDRLGPLTSFVLPGGTEVAARLHLARAIVRRAERSAVTLSQTEHLNPTALSYLNRLSDLLFQLARAANANGTDDVLWQPGGARE